MQTAQTVDSGIQPRRKVCEILRQADFFPENLAKVLELWQPLAVPLPSLLQMATPLERLQEAPAPAWEK